MVLAPRVRRLVQTGAALALALVALLPARASADLVLSIDPLSQSVLPGGTGSFDVVVTNTGPSSVDIATFNYQLLVAETSLLSFTGVSDATSDYIFGANGFGIGAVLGSDGVFSTITVSDFLNNFVPPDPPVSLASGAIASLGLISFSVNAGAAGKDIPILIGTDIDFNFYATTNTGLITPIAFGSPTGSTVQVVPEPSSLLMMVGAGVLTFANRRKFARAAGMVAA